MSHDFVEAALMRRAGWKVWIAHDLDGSYEQVPPNLLAELGSAEEAVAAAAP